MSLWAASHVVKSVYPHFLLLALKHLVPLSFSARSRLPQRENLRAALIALTIQKCTTHACAHVCLRTRILTDSGDRTLVVQADTGMALALFWRIHPFHLTTLLLCSVFRGSEILQGPPGRTNDYSDSPFQCNTKATTALLAV